jgi:hypothetical protein
MARISTYSIDSLPTIDDKLIGTDLDDSSITKNYKIGDIIGLVNQTTSLQDVLNVDNSATEDINLHGKITTENLQVNDSASFSGGTVINDVLEVWADSTFEGSVSLQSFVLDSQSQVGALGQVLKSTGSGVEWSDETPQVQATLQSVLDNGNTAVQGMGLTGSIQVVGSVRTDDLIVDAALTDSTGSTGTAGQVLSSTGTATEWITGSGGSAVTTFTPVFGTAVPNDTTAQEPAGLNTPLKVKFGNGAFSSDVIIDQFGDITFLTAGTYFFTGIANFTKIDGSSKTSKILYRVVFRGTQVGPTKVVDVDKLGYNIPVSLSYALTVEANDVMYFEIMRDSDGDNSGGLYPQAVGGGTWSDVPSTELTIWKLTN